MKKASLFTMLMMFVFILGVPGLVRADGNDVSITGEVIDTFCYATMGAKGDSHAKCGIACVNKGTPAGIVEEGTGKVYVLLPAKDQSGLSQDVINSMGKKVTLTGDTYTTGGTQFLKVESIKK